MATIDLILKPTGLIHFYPWLQEGVRVETQLGCSIGDLLGRQLEIPASVLENRIQTVFLDGHPVDDFEKTVLKEGAAVALSAALPGLLGAVMRRGGRLGCLRSSISYQPEDASGDVKKGTILLRLFNLLLKELGPLVLQRGIWVGKAALLSWLESNAADIGRDMDALRVDGMDYSLEKFIRYVKTTGLAQLFLRVEFTG